MEFFDVLDPPLAESPALAAPASSEPVADDRWSRSARGRPFAQAGEGDPGRVARARQRARPTPVRARFPADGGQCGLEITGVVGQEWSVSTRRRRQS